MALLSLNQINLQDSVVKELPRQLSKPIISLGEEDVGLAHSSLLAVAARWGQFLLENNCDYPVLDLRPQADLISHLISRNAIIGKSVAPHSTVSDGN